MLPEHQISTDNKHLIFLRQSATKILHLKHTCTGLNYNSSEKETFFH